jgi:hypothetical protein
MGKLEWGLRPVGVIGTYAPEGRWNAECGMRNGEVGKWNGEVGMRPPASPSCRLYEPEAVGVIGAYPPAWKPMAYKPTGWKRPRREGGMGKVECGMWNGECGSWNAEGGMRNAEVGIGKLESKLTISNFKNRSI